MENTQWTNPPITEIKKERFRSFRGIIFKAFDLWEKAVLRNREQDSQEVMDWYQEMLNFTEQITEDTNTNDYPMIPEVLKKYLN